MRNNGSRHCSWRGKLPLQGCRVVEPAIKRCVVLDGGDCESVAWIPKRHVEALIELESILAFAE